MISKSVAESFANEFLKVAKQFQANVEPVKVLKSRTYKIAEANVLVRAATEGKKELFSLAWICTEFINAWELLLKTYKYSATQNTVEESLHSVIQGRLIEIGNIRGFHTFCPDKSKKFNDVELGKFQLCRNAPNCNFPITIYCERLM